MGLFLVWCVWLRDCPNIVDTRIPELQSRHPSILFCRWLCMHPGIPSCLLVFSVWPTTVPGFWIAYFFLFCLLLSDWSHRASNYLVFSSAVLKLSQDACLQLDQSLPGTEGCSEQLFICHSRSMRCQPFKLWHMCGSALEPSVAYELSPEGSRICSGRCKTEEVVVEGCAWRVGGSHLEPSDASWGFCLGCYPRSPLKCLNSPSVSLTFLDHTQHWGLVFALYMSSEWHLLGPGVPDHSMALSLVTSKP